MSELSRSLDNLKDFAEDWFIAETQRRAEEARLDRESQMEIYKYLIEKGKTKKRSLDSQYQNLKTSYEERGGEMDALDIKFQTFEGQELLDISAKGPLAMLDGIYEDINQGISANEANIKELKQANYHADVMDSFLSQAHPSWGGDPNKIDPEDLDVAFNKMLKESGKVMDSELTEEDVAALGGPLAQYKTPEKLQELQEDYIDRAQTDITFLEGKEKVVNKSLNVILSPLRSKLETIFQESIMAQNNKSTLVLSDRETEEEDAKIVANMDTAGKTLFPFIGNDALRNQMARNMYAAMWEAQDRTNPNNQGLIDYLEVVSTYYTNTAQTNPDMAARVAELITPLVGLDITNISDIETIIEQQSKLIQINLDKLNFFPTAIPEIEVEVEDDRSDLNAFFKLHESAPTDTSASEGALIRPKNKYRYEWNQWWQSGGFLNYKSAPLTLEEYSELKEQGHGIKPAREYK